jgi:hypothetical protein
MKLKKDSFKHLKLMKIILVMNIFSLQELLNYCAKLKFY